MATQFFVVCLVATSSAVAPGLVGCTPRGPEPVPESALEVVDRLEQAVLRRDYPTAYAQLDLRYRLAESLPDLWDTGPETARADLVTRMEEMFVETSELRRERVENQTMERKVLRRQGPHLWIESRALPRANAPKKSFAWRYRLTPRGGSWAITQREYLVDGTPSDSTRFWPMARRQIAQTFGRPPTLAELAANLPAVKGTMRIRALKVPERSRGPRSEAPTNR